MRTPSTSLVFACSFAAWLDSAASIVAASIQRPGSAWSDENMMKTVDDWRRRPAPPPTLAIEGRGATHGMTHNGDEGDLGLDADADGGEDGEAGDGQVSAGGEDSYTRDEDPAALYWVEVGCPSDADMGSRGAGRYHQASDLVAVGVQCCGSSSWARQDESHKTDYGVVSCWRANLDGKCFVNNADSTATGNDNETASALVQEDGDVPGTSAAPPGEGDGQDGKPVTWLQAFDVCDSKGLRLCSRRELGTKDAMGCCGSGCELDAGLVWTSTKALSAAGVRHAVLRGEIASLEAKRGAITSDTSRLRKVLRSMLHLVQQDLDSRGYSAPGGTGLGSQNSSSEQLYGEGARVMRAIEDEEHKAGEGLDKDIGSLGTAATNSTELVHLAETIKDAVLKIAIPEIHESATEPLEDLAGVAAGASTELASTEVASTGPAVDQARGKNGADASLPHVVPVDQEVPKDAQKGERVQKTLTRRETAKNEDMLRRLEEIG